MLGKVKNYILNNTKFGKTRYLNFLYNYDLKQYYKSSCMNIENPETIATNIRLISHSIEKALTLPNCKADFGSAKIKELIKYYHEYEAYKDKKDLQVLDLVKSTIKAYADFRIKHDQSIDFIPKEFLKDESSCEVGPIELDVKVGTSFAEVAYGRHSTRNFADRTLSKELIKKVVELAQTAPSACNRQPIRIYACINSDKIDDILKMHGGLRGFGKPAVVFAITGDLTLYQNEFERNNVFIDGGIFLMNLLYSLDSFGLASCPIIWGSEPDNDKILSDLLGIPESNKIVALAVAGYYPGDKYIAAESCKREIESALKIVE